MFPSTINDLIMTFDPASGWREVDNVLPRSEGKVAVLDELFESIKNARPADASEIKGKLTKLAVKFVSNSTNKFLSNRMHILQKEFHFWWFTGSNNEGTSPMHPRKSNMRKSIKNLFSSAPKFQKTLKRYCLLLSLLYFFDEFWWFCIPWCLGIWIGIIAVTKSLYNRLSVRSLLWSTQFSVFH